MEKPTKLPLDDKLYSLDGEELSFFQDQTGIKDEAKLKGHIIAVQEKAYKVYGYPCIQRFAFTRLKISRLPAYKDVLALGKRDGAILLDIGCCFGNDVRKAVADGWPAQNALASDLYQEFWDCGHELFKSNPQSFPVTFICGDAFDSAMIALAQPYYEEPATPRPPLSSLISLTPLQGHISAIHASSFFHLFDEEKQWLLAQLLATLLSPRPGSVIFGSHSGRATKGFRTDIRTSTGEYMFCHSPESWRNLWDGQIFKKGSVKVNCGLKKVERSDLPAGAELFLLWWSVTRT